MAAIYEAYRDFLQSPLVEDAVDKVNLYWMIYSLLTFVVFTALLPLRLDDTTTIPYLLVWAPVWLWVFITQKALWWNAGIVRCKHGTIKNLLLFVPLIILGTIWNFLVASSWDGLYATNDVWTFTGPAFAAVGVIIFIGMPVVATQKGILAIPVLMFGLWMLVCTILSGLAMELILPWASVLVILLHIPIALIGLVLVVLGSVELVVSLRDAVRTPIATVVFFLAMATGYVFLVWFDTLLVEKLDNNSTRYLSWVNVFQPLYVVDILLLAICFAGYYTRKTLDARRVVEEASVKFLETRERLFTSLEAKFSNYMQEQVLTSQMGEQLRKFFDEAQTKADGGPLSDVHIQFQGKVFHGHRIVFAARRSTWDILHDFETSSLMTVVYHKETRTYEIKELISKTNKLGKQTPGHLTLEYLENALLYIYSGSPVYAEKFEHFCVSVGVVYEKHDRTEVPKNFAHILDSHVDLFRDLWDVTLVAGTQRVNCHKSLLAARSVFFTAMFHSGFAESRQREVRLHDVPGPLLRPLIEMIYSEKISIQEEQIPEFMRVAHELGLTDAIGYVQHMMYPLVSLSNVLDIVQVADIYELNQLKKYCIYFISIDFEYLAKKSRWRELSVQLRDEIQKHKHVNLKNLTLDDVATLEKEVDRFDDDLKQK